MVPTSLQECAGNIFRGGMRWWQCKMRMCEWECASEDVQVGVRIWEKVGKKVMQDCAAYCMIGMLKI